MKKIVVLTDIHLKPEGETIIGIDPAERLKAAVTHINQTSGDADLLIVTGDLTHHGDPQSYARVREILAGLAVPYRLLIGNHDLRENFVAEFPEVARDENGFVQFSERAGDWQLIGLDSLNGPPYTYPERHAGLLCSKRLQFLDRSLGEAGGRRAVIFLHHPPFVSGFPGMDDIRLSNAAEFLDLVRRHGNVQLVVSGHIHRTMSANIGGVPQALFKSTSHQMPLDFVSRDSSIAVIEPPAYGILLLTDEGVVVHTEDYLWPAVSGETVIA